MLGLKLNHVSKRGPCTQNLARHAIEDGKCNHSSMTFFLIDEINCAKVYNTKTVCWTQQIHRLKTISSGVVAVKPFTCSCPVCISREVVNVPPSVVGNDSGKNPTQLSMSATNETTQHDIDPNGQNRGWTTRSYLSARIYFCTVRSYGKSYGRTTKCCCRHTYRKQYQ